MVAQKELALNGILNLALTIFISCHTTRSSSVCVRVKLWIYWRSSFFIFYFYMIGLFYSFSFLLICTLKSKLSLYHNNLQLSYSNSFNQKSAQIFSHFLTRVTFNSIGCTRPEINENLCILKTCCLPMSI
jgi:hypothetical protein